MFMGLYARVSQRSSGNINVCYMPLESVLPETKNVGATMSQQRRVTLTLCPLSSITISQTLLKIPLHRMPERLCLWRCFPLRQELTVQSRWVSLCSPGGPQIPNPLVSSPKCQDYRYAPPSLASQETFTHETLVYNRVFLFSILMRQVLHGANAH